MSLPGSVKHWQKLTPSPSDSPAADSHRTTLFPFLPPRLLPLPVVCLILTVLVLPVFCRQPFTINEKTLRRAEKVYGHQARDRLLAWQQLIRAGQTGSDREKLTRVNHFFNQIPFIDDAVHWHREDYWATPLEFIASDGGDCEDFSIAKYFTLKGMGVAERKLNLTYVKAIRLRQAHMVVTYYPTAGAEPLVLDNLTDAIEPASKRTDLLPVYSFNGTGLWLAKQRGRGKKVGTSEQLKSWQQLLERMPGDADSLLNP